MSLPRGTRRLPAGLTAALGALALCATTLSAAGAATAVGPATTDTSPVNLSAKINMAAGKAAQEATVVAGDARFEVLTPEVVRLEYSPTGQFLDQPTLNVLDRDFPVPSYTRTEQGGWLVLRTSDVVLRYRLGSGPFSPRNTQLQLLHPLPGSAATVSPTWGNECTFGQVCQSGAAALAGGTALATNHDSYTSPPGFIAGYSSAGASASWQLLGAPGGTAAVTIRYSNYIGSLGGPAPRTMSLVVNGTAAQVTEPAATQLTISPSSSIMTMPGATSTVSATLANSGSGAVSGVALSLSAPSGWKVTPTTATTAPGLGAGSSLTASWSVTAPAGAPETTQTADLSATASYTDATTGEPATVTTQQIPTPVITSVSPATASAGQVVTVSGVNFGATQGDSYITFSDDGTNWGAPPDLATFSLDSWSNTAITFTIPSPSGSGGEWAVVPGSTATVTVTSGRRHVQHRDADDRPGLARANPPPSRCPSAGPPAPRDRRRPSAATPHSSCSW